MGSGACARAGYHFNDAIVPPPSMFHQKTTDKIGAEKTQRQVQCSTASWRLPL